MDVAQYLLMVPLSLGLAIVLVWVAEYWRGQKQAHQTADEPSPTAVLLYRAGVLIDANAAGRSMIQGQDDHASEWEHLHHLLAGRFPGFPSVQGDTENGDIRTYPSRTEGDSGFVSIEHWDDKARVTLVDLPAQRPVVAISERPESHRTVSEAPYPIWQSDASGQVTWANAAYFRLAQRLELSWDAPSIPVVFDKNPASPSDQPVRTAVSGAAQNQSHWFDVFTVQGDDQLTHYATDANAIVNAEVAQRNFVQTLTKTFAQLSIGLAIFDRKRQLALFNPALIDLTALPADFLSSRPNLLTFFDRMRENRMMPEPRNYASWREQIAELVVAASDDRYTETWTLPSGVTYRVVGRPHPDGATAFLFEDISAEVSLARRFRADLELGHASLDTIRDGLAVFSPTGTLGFCNSTFRSLWDVEPELSVTEYTFHDALTHLRAQCEKTDVWERLRHHVLDLNPRESWKANLRMLSGKPLALRVVSLNGGYTSVLFEDQSTKAGQTETTEMMAG
ncbi:PAS-domain containing protein [uncultured Shimia sp.]|uniref:PAS-domain containing protein n=1 Tax=uncultured Shimia sp. TaxID=573152 RepID=UPI0026285868|nr:PAS-domain containing protein [uncultured Shimia sp.]